jgi:hypothetical protein
MFASCNLFPSHFVVLIFDEAFRYVDSIYVSDFWTQNDIDKRLEEITRKYDVDRWISSEERKILERNL